jgi:D-xylose 1-dehydrogenase (NADP+, D-xylono-1,5-lactone-forming)
MWIPDDSASFQILRQQGDFGTAVEDIPTPGQNQMVHMLDHFAEAVAEKRDCSPHPIESVKTGHVMDAIAKSARTGKVVNVGES